MRVEVLNDLKRLRNLVKERENQRREGRERWESSNDQRGVRRRFSTFGIQSRRRELGWNSEERG